MKSKPELLLPAGDLMICKLAIDHGADAVYVGFEQFSARAKAKNLSLDEMREAITYAHERGAKIFCALNIILFNDELEEAIEVIANLVAEGIDAFIVQDFGIAALLLSHFPETEVHASTQMAIMNVCGVQTMEALGFDRVVLARETSLEMMHKIRERSQIDLEVFIQGALCVSYSGLCYLSSLHGDRSGNRGQCAQPCRRRYSLVAFDNSGKEQCFANKYLLSPKDINLLPDLNALMTVPVQSLKVEGRMKQPEYVVMMADVYRKHLDLLAEGKAISADELAKDLRDMAAVFNREGFSEAYFHGVPGASMMSYHTPKNTGIPLGKVIKITKNACILRLQESLHTGDGVAFYDADLQPLWGGYVDQLLTENGSLKKSFAPGEVVHFKHTLMEGAKIQKVSYCYKTFDKELSKSLLKVRSLPQKEPEKKGTLHFYVEAQEGKPFSMVVLYDDSERMKETISFQWRSEFIVESSKNDRSSHEVIEQGLKKVSNAGYNIGTLEISGSDNIFVPMSLVTAGRKGVIAHFDEVLSETVSEGNDKMIKGIDIAERIEACFEVLDEIPPQIRIPHEPNISVQVRTKAQAEAAIAAGANELNILLLNSYQNDGLTNEEIVLLSEQIPLILTLPPLIKEIEEESYYTERCKELIQQGLRRFMISNIGQIKLLEDLDIEYTACDYQLNVTNDLTASSLSQIGVSRQTLSIELDRSRMESLSSIGNIPMELVIYGRLPVMNTRYCPMGSIVGKREVNQPCSRPCLKHSFALKQEDKYYSLFSDQFCNVYILNDKVYDLMPYLGEITGLSVNHWRIAGAWMTPQEICDAMERLAILRQQLHGDNTVVTTFSKNTTSGHFIKGVR